MTDERRRHPPKEHPTRDFAREIVYAPDLDGKADPGEIVWVWVPFEEDPTQGKDRPVLVVGRHAQLLLGLMLSSKEYHRDDDNWFPIGAGAWDSEHRPSFVRLDRVQVVPAEGIRREGAICDPTTFEAIADELRQRYGWR
ncbi:MAG: type II toxin-antitoxin system PemK/MazF family toxin [Gordonia sp. (in: high G+C Gram-positive bacteria)]|uniref:type II toxin-antitoxin system PemK/MazF family toxin n=1 Tax=Gordonia sp. (in: high G+C Gram-positive bacteria) TaxID=84139 RepID=UPI0039E4AD51